MRTAFLSSLAVLVLVSATVDAEAGYRHRRHAYNGYHRHRTVEPEMARAATPKALAYLPGAAKLPSVPTAKSARKAGYKPLSEITGGAYPAFTPGVGEVYVKRDSLPTGPFVAYDHDGKLVSTFYKFPLDGMANKQKFDAAGARMAPVDHVSAYFGGSHAGVDYPHYNYVFWHVSKKDESRVAN